MTTLIYSFRDGRGYGYYAQPSWMFWLSCTLLLLTLFREAVNLYAYVGAK